MAQTFSATHVLPCTVDDYWRLVYEDEDFHQAIASAQRLKEYRLLDSQDYPDRLVHRVRIVPERDMPAAVRKVIKNATAAFEEISTFWKEKRFVEWSVRPDALGDRFQGTGTLEVFPTDRGCRRFIKGSIAVRMFGIGGLLERTIAKNVQQSFDTSARLFKQFLEARG